MQEIIIGKNQAGQRLNKYIQKYLKEAPGSFIYKMLRKKNIELNCKKATGNEILKEGDSVRFFLSDETISKFRGSEKNICKKHVHPFPSKDIIYEDENIILAYKDAGILSQKSSPEDQSINEMLIEYLISTHKITLSDLETFKPSVCNRLDRNTSGIITFGKTLRASQVLSSVFKDRTVSKYYLAIVYGHIEEEKEISGYLSKDEKINKVTVYSENVPSSHEIHTKYTPLAYGHMPFQNTPVTLLKIKLITGKTHQIRAHLSWCGYPLVGDNKYTIEKKYTDINKKMKINYQMLHSYQISFPKLEDEFKNISLKSFLVPPKGWNNRGIIWEHGTPEVLGAQPLKNL